MLSENRFLDAFRGHNIRLTKVKSTSATLIDLILTNTPENILQSGVIHLGISDHSLVYALRKFSLPKSFPKCKDVRNFKNFNENQFILDVMLIPWELVYQHNDPNLCWQVWKNLFLQGTAPFTVLKYLEHCSSTVCNGVHTLF